MSRLLKLRRPFVLKLFLFRQLPLAFFAGVKLAEIDDQRVVATIRYRWMTQNPFRSMYFAAQAMAAEFSTGILAAHILDQSKANVSMLVVKVESEYFQKVTSKVSFTCEDGPLLKEGIHQCISTDEPLSIRTTSVGTLADGTVVSKFYFTWSFKRRQSTVVKNQNLISDI